MNKPIPVLILSSDLDFATDRVCRELVELEVRFLRLNREQLPAITLNLDPLSPRLICKFNDRESIIDRSLKRVWWRQGTFDRNSPGRELDLSEQLVRSQWSAFMRNLMVFDSAKWINHPAATYRAEAKALQLFEAKNSGFEVPETRMTNDKNAPITSQVGQYIAMKSVDTMMLREGDDHLFAYTNILPWADIANESLIEAPLTVQQVLEPKLDLRVTILRNRVWCVEIKKDGKKINGDWRLANKSLLSYVDHILPSHVEKSCFLIMEKLGLAYGAIDLALVNGKYFFIEINPTGEWGWLDTDGRQISKAIATELAFHK